jgi:hypothetical protein
VANYRFSVVASGETFRALLERCCGLQQGGRQARPPSDRRKLGRRLLPVSKVAVRNRQRTLIRERLVEGLRSLYLEGQWDLFAPRSCCRFLLLVAKTRFMVSQNGLEGLSLERGGFLRQPRSFSGSVRPRGRRSRKSFRLWVPEAFSRRRGVRNRPCWRRRSMPRTVFGRGNLWETVDGLGNGQWQGRRRLFGPLTTGLTRLLLHS